MPRAALCRARLRRTTRSRHPTRYASQPMQAAASTRIVPEARAATSIVGSARQAPAARCPVRSALKLKRTSPATERRLRQRSRWRRQQWRRSQPHRGFLPRDRSMEYLWTGARVGHARRADGPTALPMPAPSVTKQGAELPRLRGHLFERARPPVLVVRHLQLDRSARVEGLQLVVHVVVALKVAGSAREDVDVNVGYGLPRGRAVLHGDVARGALVPRLDARLHGSRGAPQVAELVVCEVSHAGDHAAGHHEHVTGHDGLEVDKRHRQARS
mmetsp:Transcript_14878/g.50157  ORF Transcript_14878/g.50157 Transcript_14878/m.50157 type:complete len:272 (+) Transcript_14878:2129-2944(+)